MDQQERDEKIRWDEKIRSVPAVLQRFLENLNDRDADAIWDWVDTYPGITSEAIVNVLCLSHQNLQ